MDLIKKMMMLISCIFISYAMFLYCDNAKVYASNNNAYDFYQTYGNRTIFKATSKTDGYIYYATKGNQATSTTKYKTVGWKMTFYGDNNKVLQTMYFKLGGTYLKQISSISKGGYSYGLYALELDNLRKRLNSNAKKSFDKGKCHMLMDACMVVSRNGNDSGKISDSGRISGKVYTTYSGIKAAANWSRAAKMALISYYSKIVQDLFYEVKAEGKYGIAAVKGGGTYCYGSKVLLKANPKKGYVFEHWISDKKYKEMTKSFYVNSNSTWVAVAKPISVNVTFYRNFDKTDKTKCTQKFVYDAGNNRLRTCDWMKEGYTFCGWAEERDGKVKYKNEMLVTSKWILNSINKKSLYAVWKPNEYEIVFDGEIAEKIDNVKKNYEDYIKLPKNGAFLGWSLYASKEEADYVAGEKISVKQLVKELGLERYNESKIHLHAIWEEIPRIDAGDLYYSLEEAKTGKITEAELLSHAKAYDLLDGEIPCNITTYNSDTFTSMMKNGVVPIEYNASNSKMIRVAKEILVYIVDTLSSNTKQKIRFISDKYLLDENGDFVDEKAGGLYKDSCWKTDKDYLAILKFALEA